MSAPRKMNPYAGSFPPSPSSNLSQFLKSSVTSNEYVAPSVVKVVELCNAPREEVNSEYVTSETSEFVVES